MRFVVFGLSLSSSWGNGHATQWRGLCRALHAMGHQVVFYERDVPIYASNRDLTSPDYCELVLYEAFADVYDRAARDVAAADAAFVTSYCPDALTASDLVVNSKANVRIFYDLDAPVTLDHVENGTPVAYVGPRGYADFDLVLSFTGGNSLAQLVTRMGAKITRPLYGSVDPDAYFPAHHPRWSCDCSYLGNYSPDRERAVEDLFFEPARRLPDKQFMLGGSMYPAEPARPANMRHIEHVPPPSHPAFYGSSEFTLNVTRSVMAKNGFCPSGRMFEAAACGTPILSDGWEGLDHFFEPGREIVLVQSADDVLRAIRMTPGERARVAAAARRRVLSRHTATTRAHELVAILRAFRGNAFTAETPRYSALGG